MKKLIVIEGTDGSGKKTQADLLRKNLAENGYSVTEQSFPNYESQSSGPVKMYLGGELCENANELNAYQSSALFSVDRLCTMQKLKNDTNDIGVFDRYVQSNLIHQGSKINDKQELVKYADWLYDFEFNKLNLQRPDMVIFLNMPPEKSIELASGRGELKSGLSKDIHEKDTAHLIKAHKTGMWLAKKLKWKVIDCLNEKGNVKTREEIQTEILKVVKQLLPEKSEARPKGKV